MSFPLHTYYCISHNQVWFFRCKILYVSNIRRRVGAKMKRPMPEWPPPARATIALNLEQYHHPLQVPEPPC